MPIPTPKEQNSGVPQKEMETYARIYSLLHELIEKKRNAKVARYFLAHAATPEGRQFIEDFLDYIEKHERMYDEPRECLLSVIQDPGKYLPPEESGQGLNFKKARAYLARLKGFSFLNRIVDLGPPRKKLPKKIPALKIWKARATEYQGMTPEEKITTYLLENWKHYPVYLGYFEKRGGQNFYAYVTRRKLTHLLPTFCEADILLRLNQNGK